MYIYSATPDGRPEVSTIGGLGERCRIDSESIPHHATFSAQAARLTHFRQAFAYDFLPDSVRISFIKIICDFGW
jgi:hypothetical protein